VHAGIREWPGRWNGEKATSNEDIATLMNNRQNGRRRGRGGVRPPSGGNMGNDRGSRIDNRSRGNATQLYDKYKALARDAQMQGDRVMTEYYLQFADHYFRVLNENRPRFEEQNRRPRDEGFDEEYEGEGDASPDEREPRRDAPRPEQAVRHEHVARHDPQPADHQRELRYEDAERQPARDARNGEAAVEGGEQRRPRRNRRSFEENGEATPRMEADRLPPALARANAEEVGDPASEPDGAEPAPAPRARRPRTSEGTVAVEA